jgi:hypothetical protein
MELIKITLEDGREMISAKHLNEMGHKVTPFVSLISTNELIFNELGELIDVLVPAENYHAHLIKNTERPKKEERVHTYFILCEGTNFIKIGKTKDIKKRIEMLQTGLPQKLRLVASVREDIENKLHKRFAHLRHNGEWFQFTQEIKNFIKTLENAH